MEQIPKGNTPISGQYVQNELMNYSIRMDTASGEIIKQIKKLLTENQQTRHCSENAMSTVTNSHYVKPVSTIISVSGVRILGSNYRGTGALGTKQWVQFQILNNGPTSLEQSEIKRTLNYLHICPTTRPSLWPQLRASPYFPYLTFSLSSRCTYTHPFYQHFLNIYLCTSSVDTQRNMKSPYLLQGSFRCI